MFGYVKPFKPEMKICEYDTYKAVYCGLCKQLGSSFGPFSRFTLSYDFTFLAILGMAVREESPAFSPVRCFANPLKKCMSSAACFPQDFAASSAMIMLYYKVLDNRADSKFWGKVLSELALPIVARARKKATERFPCIDTAIAAAMAEQSALEREGCRSIDRACEPTAKSLEHLCGLLSEDPMQKRVLQRLGYLTGRYVYLCDALDDLPQDLGQDSYNPFLESSRKDGVTPDANALDCIRQWAVGSLYLTIGEIGKTFELLNLYRYESILANVVYLGLKATVSQIQNKGAKPV